MATDTGETADEIFVTRKVRYMLDLGDRIVVVENVPARVSARTGEQFFSPEIVAGLHQIVRRAGTPARFAETAIYDFDAAESDCS